MNPAKRFYLISGWTMNRFSLEKQSMCGCPGMFTQSQPVDHCIIGDAYDPRWISECLECGAAWEYSENHEHGFAWQAK